MAKILTLTLNPALDITIGLDTLRPGQVNRSQEQHSHAAGKGLNVARYWPTWGTASLLAASSGVTTCSPSKR